MLSFNNLKIVDGEMLKVNVSYVKNVGHTDSEISTLGPYAPKLS